LNVVAGVVEDDTEVVVVGLVPKVVDIVVVELVVELLVELLMTPSIQLTAVQTLENTEGNWGKAHSPTPQLVSPQTMACDWLFNSVSGPPASPKQTPTPP
jgi:hypothetical protein